MARILITSGPTREYLDPVRFLTNGSSGRMGAALANQALLRRHDVVVVSGPVSIEYPAAAQVIRVESTQEMLNTCLALFPDCDGVIAAAAPCDYGPKSRERHKISKAGESLVLELIETPDIIALLGKNKRLGQWSVAFALETQNGFQHALEKLRGKHCDLIVLNDVSAIESATITVHVIDPDGNAVMAQGCKDDVASSIFDYLELTLLFNEQL